MKSIIYIIAFVLILQAIYGVEPCGAQNNTSGASGSQIYSSKNISNKWTQTELNNKTVSSLTVSGNNIYAGTYGVYLSTNMSEALTDTNDLNKDIEKFKEKAEIYKNLNPKPEISEDVRKYAIQALALTKNKKYEEALDLYKKIFELDETFPDAHFNVALLHGQMENYESAVLEMKKYLLLVPDASDARAAKDKIYEWEVNIDKKEEKKEEKKKTEMVYVGTIPDFSEEVAGYKIGGVSPGSPAEKAGLISGDIIIKFGDRKIKSLSDYTYAIGEHKPGEELEVIVKRGEEIVNLKITLGVRK